MTVEERITELLEDEHFLDDVREISSPEELQKVFAAYNIEVKDATLEEAYEALHQSSDTELTEEELEEVSGGGAGLYFMLKIGKYATIAVSGASASTVLLTIGGIAAIGLAAYAGYRLIKKYT